MQIKKGGSFGGGVPEPRAFNLAAGEAYWEAAEDMLDQAGVWRAQGEADRYLSTPVS